MNRKAIAAGLLMILSVVLSAENSTVIELTQLAGIGQGIDEEPVLSGISRGKITFSSAGNRNVKSELSLNTTVSETAIIDIEKAFIKVRFPAFRTTIGKTRLAWGDGFFFNTGDVIFGSVNPLADLTADEIRSETAWLNSVFIPLGRFSFIEAVYLPPQIDLGLEYWKQNRQKAEGTPLIPASPDIADTGAGIRIQGKLSQVKTEGGYYYNGEAQEHTPYISAQGNIYLDWYAAAALPLSASAASSLDDNLRVSWGLYHIAKPSRNITLNLRLEGLILPGGRWNEGTDNFAPASIEQYYGAYLYPEISIGLQDARSIFLRGVYSPIDASGLITLGGSWNIYQGFSILAYISGQAGEETDQFSVTRPGGYSVALGAEYIF